ncbi:flavin reductase family protein [Fodinibius sp. SL11]|uniref:flavin reductase family protein n=1 Tax=Fodinibius sp. SL11 TaxID=3425690 RepID=UPI003F880E81
MTDEYDPDMVELDLEQDVWNRCYSVHSLLIIGSKEEDGNYNFAPKHMAMPMGFSNHFGFMGTPRKNTYRNVQREKVFTVSYPTPDQLTVSSLAATRREDDDSKPVLDQIPTTEAQNIEGYFLKGSYFQLECELTECIGKFGEWELVVGEIVAARVDKKMVRKVGNGTGEGQLIYNNPLLAYLHPNRFSVIKESNVFPFPKEFKR